MTIYILHSCNEWKEYSSMNLLFVGTSKTKLKRKISKEIEAGNMEYSCFDDASPKQQAKSFRKEFDEAIENDSRWIDFINNRLTYGYLSCAENNEEID